uniref:Uncharacterized protein n=1 Tax=Caenorhabditis tropicalis TaxID=1561998 RepID=A0A1I7TET8_9PELO
MSIPKSLLFFLFFQKKFRSNSCYCVRVEKTSYQKNMNNVEENARKAVDGGKASVVLLDNAILGSSLFYSLFFEYAWFSIAKSK